jgi:hypothetical protein
VKDEATAYYEITLIKGSVRSGLLRYHCPSDFSRKIHNDNNKNKKFLDSSTDISNKKWGVPKSALPCQAVIVAIECLCTDAKKNVGHRKGVRHLISVDQLNDQAAFSSRGILML